jgi:hypothetical protein
VGERVDVAEGHATVIASFDAIIAECDTMGGGQQSGSSGWLEPPLSSNSVGRRHMLVFSELTAFRWQGYRTMDVAMQQEGYRL